MFIVIVGLDGVGKYIIVQEVVWCYEFGYYEKIKDWYQCLWYIDFIWFIVGMSIVGMW